MIVQKLPWAGIRIEADDVALVVDPITRILGEFGGAREPMYPLRYYGGADAVLLTHLHEDHFDPAAIIDSYGTAIPVYIPSGTARHPQLAGLENVIEVDVHSIVEVSQGVRVTALPSVDGIGDVQTAWLIEGEGRRVIHCGDTLWHGYWWSFVQQYGPIDAAFLPVNGAIVELQGLEPSGQPICLTPEQAIAAARVLGVRTLIPIHYGTMNYPPVYNETPNIADRLECASEGKVSIRLLRTTQSIAL